MTKRPAFQFYPGDWRTDNGLRLCSLVARGLWIEMMAIMHEGEPYGHLTVQGRPISVDMLARLVGEGPTVIKRAMKDLEDNDVFSRTDEGVIFSRRMVRDEEIRNARAAGGSLGKEHGRKGASHGAKGGRPRKEKTPLDETGRGVILPPPSSPSSSPSPNIDDVDERRAREIALEAPIPVTIVDLTDMAARAAGIRHVDPGPIVRAQELVEQWVAYGATPDEVMDTVRTVSAQVQEPINSLRYFDRHIRQTVARRENSNGENGSASPAEQSNDPLIRAAAARRAQRRAGEQAEHFGAEGAGAH